MKSLSLALILLATVAWAEPATINREGQLVWSGTTAVQAEPPKDLVLPSGIVITGVTYRDKTLGTVEINDLIKILEQARPHVWTETTMITTAIYDGCITDAICMAEREVKRMKQRKKLAERIDEVVRVLRDANK
jgi:hypothetical protein